MQETTISLISAIAASVGAVTSVVTLAGVSLSAYWAVKRRRQAETDRWHVDIGQELPEGTQIVIVRDGPDRAFLVLEVEVLSPEGAKIRGRGWGESDDGYAVRIKPNFTLRERLRYNDRGEAYPDPAALPLLLDMPSRPYRSRSEKTRLLISVTAEEVSAQRRQIKIPVNSQDIAWSAKNTDIQA